MRNFDKLELKSPIIDIVKKLLLPVSVNVGLLL